MKLSQRFARLSFWNKFAFVAGLASLVSLVLTIVFWLYPKSGVEEIPLYAPQLSGPPDMLLAHHYPRTIDLKWKESIGATSYILEIQYQSPIDPIWYDAPHYPQEIQWTSQTFTLIGLGKGRWRVIAKNSVGRRSFPTKWRYFTFTV